LEQVYERVFVAGDAHCRRGDAEWAVVHACKSPCHQHALGYRGSLSNSHPNYLTLHEGSDLYMNIIDPPRPLFMPPSFSHFLGFSEEQWTAGKKLLIHCNKGESRAPSLALLFLAKCRHAIDDASYPSASSEFETLYPRYSPGKGIQMYFSNNWATLGDMGSLPHSES
jgi:hypothetical protein